MRIWALVYCDCLSLPILNISLQENTKRQLQVLRANIFRLRRNCPFIVEQTLPSVVPWPRLALQRYICPRFYPPVMRPKQTSPDTKEASFPKFESCKPGTSTSDYQFHQFVFVPVAEFITKDLILL